MIPITIAGQLNHLPHRETDTSFPVWKQTYHYHLYNLFLIFVSRLQGIEPFSSKDIDDQAHFEKFCKYLYKRSSRVV